MHKCQHHEILCQVYYFTESMLSSCAPAPSTSSSKVSSSRFSIFIVTKLSCSFSNLFLEEKISVLFWCCIRLIADDTLVEQQLHLAPKYMCEP